jgi:competence protein ComEA
MHEVANLEPTAYAPIDLNLATADQLRGRLRGVGPKLARKIIAFRDQNGPFVSVSDLRGVAGIGENVIAELEAYAVRGDEGEVLLTPPAGAVAANESTAEAAPDAGPKSRGGRRGRATRKTDRSSPRSSVPHTRSARDENVAHSLDVASEAFVDDEDDAFFRFDMTPVGATDVSPIDAVSVAPMRSSTLRAPMPHGGEFASERAYGLPSLADVGSISDGAEWVTADSTPPGSYEAIDDADISEEPPAADVPSVRETVRGWPELGSLSSLELTPIPQRDAIDDHAVISPVLMDRRSESSPPLSGRGTIVEPPDAPLSMGAFEPPWPSAPPPPEPALDVMRFEVAEPAPESLRAPSLLAPQAHPAAPDKARKAAASGSGSMSLGRLFAAALGIAAAAAATGAIVARSGPALAERSEVIAAAHGVEELRAADVATRARVDSMAQTVGKHDESVRAIAQQADEHAASIASAQVAMTKLQHDISASRDSSARTQRDLAMRLDRLESMARAKASASRDEARAGAPSAREAAPAAPTFFLEHAH